MHDFGHRKIFRLWRPSWVGSRDPIGLGFLLNKNLFIYLYCVWRATSPGQGNWSRLDVKLDPPKCTFLCRSLPMLIKWGQCCKGFPWIILLPVHGFLQTRCRERAFDVAVKMVPLLFDNSYTRASCGRNTFYMLIKWGQCCRGFPCIILLPVHGFLQTRCRGRVFDVAVKMVTLLFDNSYTWASFVRKHSTC